MPKDKGKDPAPPAMPYSLRKTTKRAKAKPDETLATPGPVTLYCLVRGGEDLSHVFSVKINKDATVGELKKAIKAERLNSFAKFDAATIVLRKVNIPTTQKMAFEALKNAEADIKTDLGGVTMEDVTSEIADEFGNLPTKRHIHVIVEPPQGKKRILVSLR
jgi:hypothetical protein